MGRNKVENRYLRIQRIIRSRNYGFEKKINEFNKLITSNLYSESLIDKIAKTTYNQRKPLGESVSTEYLNDLFNELNERAENVLKKLPQFFRDVLVQGSKKVFGKDGKPLKLEVPDYTNVIKNLVDDQKKYLNNITDKQRSIIDEEISKGIEEGKTYSQMAKSIKSRTSDFTKERAELIANTECHRAHSTAMETTMREAGFERYQWVTANDDRVAPLDKSMHRKIFEFGKEGTMPWRGADGKTYELDKSPKPVHSTHPRCFDMETEVLTNKGWKYFKDVSMNDKVFSLNPKNKECGWQNIKHLVSYKYTGEMLNFYNNYNFNALVTPNHEFWYYSNNGKLQSKEAQEVAQLKYFKIPRLAKWHSQKKTLKINQKSYDGKKFGRFLAWYLSDGSTVKRGNSLQTSIHQEQRRDILRDCLDTCKIGYYETKDKFYITDSDIKSYVYNLGKAKTKYVPQEFKELSKDCLLSFVKEYLYADGHSRKPRGLGKSNSWYFFTQSNQLASDFAEILIKCGYYASYYLEKSKTVTFKNGTYKCGAVWRIAKCERETIFEKRYGEIKPIEYDDFVYDVELEDWHILYVRRKGKCYWSGNCRCIIVPID